MKRTITVTSNTGVAVPGMGRLGLGVHKNIDLTSEQLKALQADPAAEVATANKTTTTQEA